MILIEQTQVPDAALPVAEFREHLQLGSGFADDGLQDPVLVSQLRAAIAAIEARTSKALIARDFLLVNAAWRSLGRQVFPVAPVSQIASLTIVDLQGGDTVIDANAYRLARDTHVPALVSIGLSLPTIPVGGSADIGFTAGYGAWAEVPADLRQAVFLLAAHYYDNRSQSVSRAANLPLGVVSICRQHTPVRLVGARRI
ncbi:MAG: head-tail connector protein [Pseudomonadota bacterium]